MSLLLTRPRHDSATKYLFDWASKFVQEAKRKRLAFMDLDKGKATKKNVERCLKGHDVTSVIFNGHGDAHSVKGQNFEVLIAADENEELLKGKRVFMRACEAGKYLGQKIVDAGALGFIGYKEEFMFPYDKSSTKPLDDEIAAPCLDCSNQVGLALIRGRSVKQAHEEGIQAHQEKIDKMLTSNAPNSYILWFLSWNMSNQVCIE